MWLLPHLQGVCKQLNGLVAQCSLYLTAVVLMSAAISSYEQLCDLCRTPLVVGVLGCMAERLKSKLLDQQKLADLVVGPDAYRDLPRIIAAVQVSCLQVCSLKAAGADRKAGACIDTWRL